MSIKPKFDACIATTQHALDYLDSSIEIWAKRMVTEYPSVCPLCVLSCARCPICLDTGLEQCYGTVYYSWVKSRNPHHPAYGRYKGSEFELAAEMHEYLVDLRSRCVLEA